MFRRLFQKQQQQRCGRRVGQGICCAHPLSDFAQGADVVVISNSDKKTLEMGLFSGALVHVMKNRPGDTSMVVATGESRYIISREAAGKIQVR
ncbi:MAG: ferrous iron transport protein A [Verrucomicrobia bacterium]|nr:ferrous iron transport protein A [Verrucomicrobiota bacterium]